MWLLLHGFTGSPRSWDRVVDAAGLEQTPLMPTLVGHGRDWQVREVESFESEVTRLVPLASSAGQPRLLCGYSMGARVALGLLARQPHLFDAALLIGVHPGLTNEAARSERRQVDASRAHSLRDEGLEAFVAAWEELPLFASQRDLSPEVRAGQQNIRLGHEPEGLARAVEMLGLAEMPNYRPAIAALEVPITLMTGALDAKFSEIADTIAAENTHVDAEVVDGVGHNVVLEAPAAVAAALKRIEGKARG
ncbi:MAG: alpha/beta fold hydrolase [Deltaproteobacteria bacterium]|nr:alpha/beta fold hydrolase [Deltaproteobacteria bacterium]MBW1876165.1 alpha/beta fold hydrolase [Deltaproteobacteria bacterium]MBW2551420.1 alpha/beta fold hydrolase [Deltaproteobacteria bacterium]MBW2627665.1 alpha/beta fold hydrolase [Deltaproteobacteria bacterium]MBW2685800.1 alpha/beta fold hydrolase [Deltaproteobacteria bacterium]